MPRIVGIAFNKKSRIYNFDALDFEFSLNDEVVVETERGLQYGYVVAEVKEISENEFNIPLKPVIRFATKKDLQNHNKNIEDAKLAINKAREFVEELDLDMRIIDANFTLDRKQLLFNFLADERIDFRELAKKLAQIYKTRIELRQIGIRDKAKEIGGLGPCGRMLCCNTFLTDLNSVTINMAKNQNLALNPSKINGVCGRLLCCLNYEDVVYTKLREGLPEVGDVFANKEVSGKVVSVDILKQKIHVADENNNIVEVCLKDGNSK